MELVVTIADVRNKNTRLLGTDNIENSVIESTIFQSQVKIFNSVAHIYSTTTLTAANCPTELKISITDFSAGQLIIDTYSNTDQYVEIGKMYRSDARQLIKNIISGQRKLDIEAQQTKNTQVSSFVFDTNDEGVERFINDFDNLFD